MTAKELFRRMMRDRISPSLRDRGFVGGSGKFYMQGSTGHVGSLQMTGNPKRSTADLFDYVVHIGVTSTYLRQTATMGNDPIRPKPAYWTDHDWLETVEEHRQLRDTDDVDLHAENLLAELDKVIPRVRASLTDDGLRAAVDACPVGVGRGWARLLMDITQGDLDQARTRLAEARVELGDDHLVVVRLLARLEHAERHA